jgi:hypothetical protein
MSHLENIGRLRGRRNVGLLEWLQKKLPNTMTTGNHSSAADHAVSTHSGLTFSLQADTLSLA